MGLFVGMLLVTLQQNLGSNPMVAHGFLDVHRITHFVSKCQVCYYFVMLRISWGNHIDLSRMAAQNGYGYATERITTSLTSLGYHVKQDDSSADVHFHFDQPQHLKKPREDIYTIMYHPWESTQLLPGWQEYMNSVDEVWTPSPLIAEWYEKFAGVTAPIYVFEHGVDAVWTPVQRKHEGTFKFLHVGGEAARKGVDDALQSRRLGFSNMDVEITLKVMTNNWPKVWMPKVNIVNERQSIEELVELFHSHHAFVYPSYGEGFGLTPLQAMATGMPTICTAAWAPYGQFLDPDLAVDSQMVKSPWPRIHPGNMLKPDRDHLRECMQKVHKDYDYYAQRALDRVPEITDFYSWDRLTDEAFSMLSERLKIS